MSEFRDDDRGFAPMAGTGVLVGVVVLILAVVGAAVFGLIDGVAPPDAEFEVEREGDELVVVAVGPDPVPAEELSLRGEDPDDSMSFDDWPGDGVVKPDDRMTVPNATGDETVEIVWEPAAFDRSETLGSYEPDEDSEIDGWVDENGPAAPPVTS